MSSYLGSSDSLQMRIVKYLGLLPAGVSLSMEALLRFKALVLIAVTVKRRSLRYQLIDPCATQQLTCQPLLSGPSAGSAAEVTL